MPQLVYQITIGNVLELITLFLIFVRVSRYFDRVDTMWKALMGDGPTDSHNFFNRFLVIERQNYQLWSSCNQLPLKTRKEDCEASQ